MIADGRRWRVPPVPRPVQLANSAWHSSGLERAACASAAELDRADAAITTAARTFRFIMACSLQLDRGARCHVWQSPIDACEPDCATSAEIAPPGLGRLWVNRVTLTARRSLPIFPDWRTSAGDIENHAGCCLLGRMPQTLFDLDQGSRARFWGC